MTCRELVELVSDYLEGALPAGERGRFEHHLSLCPPCVTYVEQIRTVIGGSAALRRDGFPPDREAALLSHFREWARRRGS